MLVYTVCVCVSLYLCDILCDVCLCFYVSPQVLLLFAQCNSGCRLMRVSYLVLFAWRLGHSDILPIKPHLSKSISVWICQNYSCWQKCTRHCVCFVCPQVCVCRTVIITLGGRNREKGAEGKCTPPRNAIIVLRSQDPREIANRCAAQTCHIIMGLWRRFIYLFISPQSLSLLTGLQKLIFCVREQSCGLLHSGSFVMWG